VIEELIGRMAALLESLQAAGDRRRYFHATYQRTTIAVASELRRGGFADTEWVERWDVAFAGLYLDALETALAGRRPTRPWEIAFSAPAGLPPLRHVLLGMNAHSRSTEGGSAMPRVSHDFVVDRPIQAVFDIVSTARFWPQWHPATRSVEGDVDHPARHGDQIIEHVSIAGIEGSGTWTVVEHDPPHHLALETDLAVGHLRISYQLTTAPDGGTCFRRDLDFPGLGPQIDAVMDTQSAEGTANLARLVQREIPAPGS
jgi:hypothetical protein